MSDIKDITRALVKFRDEREWAQFHNGKDLAIALNIESSELLELFLWKPAESANSDKIEEELADILAFAFLIADKYNFDIKEILLKKIAQNAQKYPIDRAKGNAKKYTDL